MASENLVSVRLSKIASLANALTAPWTRPDTSAFELLPSSRFACGVESDPERTSVGKQTHLQQEVIIIVVNCMLPYALPLAAELGDHNVHTLTLRWSSNRAQVAERIECSRNSNCRRSQ